MNDAMTCLEHADPATGRRWSEERTRAFLDEVIAAPEQPATDAARTRPARRTVIGVAAVAAAIVLTVGLIPAALGPTTGPAPVDGLFAAPNAAAAELDAYSAQAANRTGGGVPPGSWSYSRIRVVDVGQDLDPPLPVRTTREIEFWRDPSGRVRQRETIEPPTFLTSSDRARYLREVGTVGEPSVQDFAPLAAAGGSWDRPNAELAARLPIDPEALSAYLQDAVAAESVESLAPADAPLAMVDRITRALEWPWLSPAQRGALIHLLGRLPGPWTSTGATTIDGTDGVGFTGVHDGLRTEWVVSVEAPGTLSRRSVLVDPTADPAAYRGMPIGTVIHESRTLAHGVVPTQRDRPRP
jgi:hypothetical protein